MQALTHGSENYRLVYTTVCIPYVLYAIHYTILYMIHCTYPMFAFFIKNAERLYPSLVKFTGGGEGGLGI